MLRSRSLTALLLAALLALVAACGGADTNVSRETFRDDFQERANAGLGEDDAQIVTDEVADCFTDGVFEAFDQDEINDIYRTLDEEDLAGDQRDELFEINQRCFTAADAEG